MAAGD
jgi:hypothetical protein